jgi:hypothetical protein
MKRGICLYTFAVGHPRFEVIKIITAFILCHVVTVEYLVRFC